MRQFLRHQNARNWEDMRHVLSVLVSMFALWVTIWMFSRNFVGDSWRIIRIGNFLTVWLVLALLVAVIVAIGLRQHWLTAGLFLLLLLSVYQNQLWAVLFPNPLPIQVQQDDFQMMTFNVHPANTQIDRLAQLIRSSDLDIVALQEIEDDARNILIAELSSEFPYIALEEQMAVFSRFPVKELSMPEELIQSQFVLVSLPETDVYVWNVHAPTAVKQSIWEAQRRNLAIIEDYIVSTDTPIILMGDLNATHQSENYNYIAEHLQDTHLVAGEGLV